MLRFWTFMSTMSELMRAALIKRILIVMPIHTTTAWQKLFDQRLMLRSVNPLAILTTASFVSFLANSTQFNSNSAFLSLSSFAMTSLLSS